MGYGSCASNISSNQTGAVLRYSFDEASSGTTPALDTGAAPAAPMALRRMRRRGQPTRLAFPSGLLTVTAQAPITQSGDTDPDRSTHQHDTLRCARLAANPNKGDRLLADRPPDFPTAPAGTKAGTSHRRIRHRTVSAALRADLWHVSSPFSSSQFPGHTTGTFHSDHAGRSLALMSIGA